jgi:steroid delta-isomerase-like uncharacterized protein
MDNIDRFRKGIHAVNARAWVSHRALLADRFNYEDYGAGVHASTADEFVAYQQHRLAPFPDQRVTIGGIFEHEGRVCAELVAEGTHTGPLPLPGGGELPASGQHFVLHIVTVTEYDHGLAKSCRAYHNPLELMSQLRTPLIPRQIRLGEPTSVS